MKHLVDLLNESIDAGLPALIEPQGTASISAIIKLKDLKDTGWKEDFTGFTPEEIAFMQSKITNKPVLYRGMNFKYKDIDDDFHNILKSLNKGDIVPDQLHKRWNAYASYTPNLSVAQKYARDGDLNIIIELSGADDSIICQCANIDTGDPLLNAIIQPENEFLVNEKLEPDKIKVFYVDEPDKEPDQNDTSTYPVAVIRAYNNLKIKYNRYVEGIFNIICRQCGLDPIKTEKALDKQKIK